MPFAGGEDLLEATSMLSAEGGAFVKARDDIGVIAWPALPSLDRTVVSGMVGLARTLRVNVYFSRGDVALIPATVSRSFTNSRLIPWSF